MTKIDKNPCPNKIYIKMKETQILIKCIQNTLFQE